jgi:alpha-ribazole phosphatase
MKLYLIRHGESEANQKHLHAGWAPVHLTEKGIEDAKKAGKLISDIKFDKVFSSDLVRVVETCFYATGITDQEQRPELRELNVGSLAGKSPEKLMKEVGLEYIKRNHSRDYRFYGGENMEDLFSRVESFMKELEANPYSSMNNILVFASEGAIDMALASVLEIGAQGFNNMTCDNGSVSVFEYVNGLWKINKWNYTKNLN